MRFNASEYLLDRWVLDGHGDRIALRERGASVTYSQLLDRVSAAAAGLRSLGVRPEERVLLVLFDSIEFAVTFLAAMRLGAIPLPLNPLLPARDLGLAASDSRARVAVFSAQRADALADLASGAPELADVVIVGEGDDQPPSTIRMHGWEETMSAGTHPRAFASWEDSPGFWMCTSGTTGRPKLAMHRHVDVRVTAEGYAREVLELRADDRCFSVAPLFHAYGLGNSLTFPLAAGASAVLEPTRPPRPSSVADVARFEKPTLFFSVPTFYASLLAADLPADAFASVRLAVSAGEPLPAELYNRFLERFGVEILDGIGSTELTHIYISNRPDHVRPGTSGTPVRGYRIRLEDDRGDVPPDTAGRLSVAGASLATGYWCNTDETRERFRGEWFQTGDMYSRSADGFYTYLGRADDMLRVAGEWVSPAEVEAVLIEHPDVLEAAVVGLTIEGLTRPVAFVVAAPDRLVDHLEVLEFCRERLAGYKRPRRVFVVNELPKTVTGKIQRAKVRELAAERQLIATS
ncbi:MAG: benzoate-CoA ligase family protein [Gaiellaceae bacterium]